MGSCFSIFKRLTGKGKRYQIPVDMDAANKNDKNVNPKDFICSKMRGEVVIKEKLGGRDFVVEECHDVDLFLMDHICQLQLDLSSNCLLFISPCDGSIFLRDCKDMIIWCFAKQLRLRSCSNISIWGYCTSEPAIENCSNITISENKTSYPRLPDLKIKANFKENVKNMIEFPFDFGKSCSISLPKCSKTKFLERYKALKEHHHLKQLQIEWMDDAGPLTSASLLI